MGVPTAGVSLGSDTAGSSRRGWNEEQMCENAAVRRQTYKTPCGSMAGTQLGFMSPELQHSAPQALDPQGSGMPAPYSTGWKTSDGKSHSEQTSPGKPLGRSFLYPVALGHSLCSFSGHGFCDGVGDRGALGLGQDPVGGWRPPALERPVEGGGLQHVPVHGGHRTSLLPRLIPF